MIRITRGTGCTAARICFFDAKILLILLLFLYTFPDNGTHFGNYSFCINPAGMTDPHNHLGLSDPSSIHYKYSYICALCNLKI